jgi:hypothetical protein
MMREELLVVPMRREENNTKIYLKETMHLMRVRSGLSWLRVLVSTIMHLRVPRVAVDVMTRCVCVSFSNKTPHHGVCLIVQAKFQLFAGIWFLSIPISRHITISEMLRKE